jgi:hypothetical protein
VRFSPQRWFAMGAAFVSLKCDSPRFSSISLTRRATCSLKSRYVFPALTNEKKRYVGLRASKQQRAILIRQKQNGNGAK